MPLMRYMTLITPVFRDPQNHLRLTDSLEGLNSEKLFYSWL